MGHKTKDLERLPPSPAPRSHHLRPHLISTLSEFLGTFLFLFTAFAGTQTANTPNSTSGDTSTTLPTGPQPLLILFISLSFAVSLASVCWIFYRVSGGQFNPAVTMTLLLTGNISLVRAILIMPAQVLGAIAAATVVRFIFPGPLAVTTSLNGGTTLWQGVIIEATLTTQLCLTVLFLAVEKHRATFVAPLGVGLSLFTAELAGVYYTGGSLNPARSFGPCVANLDFPTDHWMYWVGPFIGAGAAAGIYSGLKVLGWGRDEDGLDAGGVGRAGYTPGQDDDGLYGRILEAVLEVGREQRGLRRVDFNGSFGRPLSMPDSIFGAEHAR